MQADLDLLPAIRPHALQELAGAAASAPEMTMRLLMRCRSASNQRVMSHSLPVLVPTLAGDQPGERPLAVHRKSDDTAPPGVNTHHFLEDGERRSVSK